MTDIFAKLIDLNRPIKRFLQMSADAVLLVVCFVAAMALRLESIAFALNAQVWLAMLPVIPLTIVVFAKLGLYRSIVRFITGQALRAIAVGVLSSAVLLLLASQALSAPIPRSVPGIYAALLFLATGGIRFLMRAILRKTEISSRQAVAIYGAGEAGRQLQNALFQGPECESACKSDPLGWVMII